MRALDERDGRWKPSGGKKTLALVNGAFSKRWFQIAQLTGKEAHAIEVPWGQAIQPERLAD